VGTGGSYDVRILDPVKNGLTPWKTSPWLDLACR
jgi:hypothetical protein